MELVLNVQELLQECRLFSFPHFIHFHQHRVEFLVQDEDFKLVLRTYVIDLHFNFLSAYLHEHFALLLLKFPHCLLYTFRFSIATNSKLVTVLKLAYFFCFDNTDSIFLKLSRSADGLNLMVIVSSR